MSNRPTKKPLASQRVREARKAGGTSKKTIWILGGVASSWSWPSPWL